jgi:hypothetical protein
MVDDPSQALPGQVTMKSKRRDSFSRHQDCYLSKLCPAAEHYAQVYFHILGDIFFEFASADHAPCLEGIVEFACGFRENMDFAC